MSILMIEERLLRFKVLVARGAGVGLDVGVDTLMNDEVTLALEAFATRLAAVVELTSVGGRVLGQTDLATECLLADHALVWFFACMLAHVFLQSLIDCRLVFCFEE